MERNKKINIKNDIYIIKTNVLLLLSTERDESKKDQRKNTLAGEQL